MIDKVFFDHPRKPSNNLLVRVQPMNEQIVDLSRQASDWRNANAGKGAQIKKGEMSMERQWNARCAAGGRPSEKQFVNSPRCAAVFSSVDS